MTPIPASGSDNSDFGEFVLSVVYVVGSNLNILH